MRKSLFLLLGISTVIAVHALPKAVCFRFDDNQNVRNYSVMAETFRKNNAVFSLSLCPLRPESKQWQKMVCRLSEEGFDIMDHTPIHSTLAIRLAPGDPLLERAKKADCVHHITDGRICLKYDMTGSIWSKPIEIEIKNGNKISAHPEFKYRRLVEIEGNYYYIVPDKLKLISIWAEDNVRLTDGKKQLRLSLSTQRPYPGSAEFMVEVSQEGFRRIGLKKMPVSWIQPGGYYIGLETVSLGKVLKKYGYVSASTTPSVIKGFGDPDMDNDRFAINWGDFNFERNTVEEAKTIIADAVACHRIPIASSHFRIKCTLEEYAAKHDQILKWCNANGIRVLPQSEVALLLLNTKIDASKNVFPSLSCDLDKNNRPDGYYAADGVKFQDGKVILPGKKKFGLKQLCGLPLERKMNFSVEHTLGHGVALFRFLNARGKLCGTAKLDLSPKNKSAKMELTLPEKCTAIDFEIINLSKEQGEVSCLSLTTKKADR